MLAASGALPCAVSSIEQPPRKHLHLRPHPRGHVAVVCRAAEVGNLRLCRIAGAAGHRAAHQPVGLAAGARAAGGTRAAQRCRLARHGAGAAGTGRNLLCLQRQQYRSSGRISEAGLCPLSLRWRGQKRTPGTLRVHRRTGDEAEEHNYRLAADQPHRQPADRQFRILQCPAQL